MPSLDIYPNLVKTALQAEDWTITHDPYFLSAGGTELYIEVKQNKVWIHWDGTEEGFINYLEQNQVPCDQIVQGWLPPEMRQHTDYAVN
ncbi:MAG: element excision factor XisI family protein [Cyanobacteria bacterium J06621_8]